MIEKQIKEIKQEYLNTPLPKSLELKGWENIINRIEQQPRKKPAFWMYPFVLATLFIVISSTVLLASQSAQPGSTFYPVKQFTKSISESILDQPKAVEPLNEIPSINTLQPEATPTPTVTPTPSPETINPLHNSAGENENKSEHQKENPSAENKQETQDRREVRGKSDSNNGNSENAKENKGQAISKEKKNENANKKN